MSKRRKAPVVEIVSDGVDIFVVADGVRIARLGHADTPHAKTWISLEPGWSVVSSEGHSEIVVTHEDVRVH